jgi:hypothetical protein
LIAPSRLFSLPPAGSEASKLALEVGELISALALRSEPGWGFKNYSYSKTPPPDRRFATATLPTRSAGEG